MNNRLLLTMGAAMLAGFGMMFVIVALAYTKDMASIARTPTIIWQYVCGIPVNDNVTVPMLVSIGSICVIGATGMWWWGRRHD